MRKYIKYIGTVLATLCLLGVVGFVIGPTSADIRLDTGDLRYRYLGIVPVYERMAEPYRSRLLALAVDSEHMEDRWVRLDDYPPTGSNNIDGMCWGKYAKLSAWALEDEQVARVLAHDLASWIRTTNAGHGLPENNAMFWLVQFDEEAGEYRVLPDWRQHEDAIYFFEQQEGLKLE